MNGRSPREFAAEFVHQLQKQRFSETSPKKTATKPAKSHDFRRKAEENAENTQKAEKTPANPSIFTYLSNNIREELEKSASKSQKTAKMLHELCFYKLSNENAARFAEKVSVISQKNAQKAFCDRLNAEAAEIRDKKLLISQKFAEKELENCRFEPEINQVSKSKQNRNPQEFFEYQVKWEEKVKDFAVFSLEFTRNY